MKEPQRLILAGGLSSAIGLRFLTAKSSNKFISFISMTAMFGIAIGIAVLLIIMSAMNGFEQQLEQRLLSVVPHGEIISVHKPIHDWKNVIEEAKTIKGVINGAPVINVKGLVIDGNGLSGIKLDGIIPQQESLIMASADYTTKGSWDKLTKDSQHIILGQGLIDKFNYKIGDNVSIMIPQTGDKGRLSAPQVTNFVLIGAFKFGGQLDQIQAYIHLDDARNLTDMTLNQPGVSSVRFKFDDVFNASQLIRNIGNNVKSYVYLSDWTRQQGHLYNDIKLVKMITYIVLVLVIAVASFNIVSTLVMAVQDKESEIAILLTMGFSRFNVMKVFVVQGMVNAILGCIIGSVFGVSLAINLPDIVQLLEQLLSIELLSGGIYFVDSLPSLFLIKDLILLVSATLFISFLATLYPAKSASKIKPALVLGQ